MRRKGDKATVELQTASLLPFSLSPFLLFSFSLILLISVLQISAATPAEYRKKIQDGEMLIKDLSGLDKESLSPGERSGREKEILTRLRRDLPSSEKIEWKGASVETNNDWLQNRLNLYEKETDAAKRGAILTETGERLAAIGQKLDELEKAIESERTKDEDKRKLREILSREEYRKPEQEEKSFIQNLLEKIYGWFADKAPTPNISPSTTKGFQSFSIIFQLLLYAAILSLIGFLIYRFAPFLAGRFRRRETREKKDRVILGERIAADESPDNIFSEAERLAREGNLRGAIRKGYIALLCDLSDRKVIGLSRHKTNRDYLRDVRKKRELYENMNGLTSNFERHWYGFDEAEEKDWEEFRSGYRKAVGIKQ